MGYLDPGLFGILSQVGLTVLLVVVSIFTFFFKPVKKFTQKVFKSKKADLPTQSDSDPSSHG
jgi:hypothetical protein